ncbi:MAG TPA: ABC transporter permease [Chitinophagaceae bacterium]|jgi:ABC-2 type transport system permease protein|nr:ABC transporter permease [Chitinophagaceae bacterium]
MNKIWIVARREFLTRVQKKTFLLTTIGLPLLIFGFYAAIIFFSVKGSDDYTVAVVDKANIFEGKLESKKEEVVFKIVQSDTAELKTQLEKKVYDAYLFVPENYTLDSDESELYFKSGKATGIMTREDIQRSINKRLEEKRMAKMNISKTLLDSLRKDSDINYTTLAGKSDSGIKAGISYGVGFISGILIYMVLFIYGTMVMRGVMEEKVSRIAEVIVSSVKPFQLMMGKIIGIGAVGLTQFIIWGILIIGLQFLLPVIFPELAQSMQSQAVQPGAMGAVNAAKQSGALDGLMAGLSQINFPLIIGCFIFYFLGGYFLYSSLFAAVGSAVNEDPQDAQSLLLPITMPIIFAFVILTKAVNDPNSPIAVFGSLFPLTSPIVMMARIGHGIPEGVSVWQLLLSMALLVAGFIATTWLAGKIYRTGILMYGKKVTWKEMWKWAFRKY